MRYKFHLKNKPLTVLFFLPVIFHSCHTSELYERQDVNRASVYEDIMMSPETPLYSFLPEKAKKPLTKSG